MSPQRMVIAAILGLVSTIALAAAEPEIKFSSCPAAVQKTMQAEAKNVKIETVTREKDAEDQPVYWADVTLDGRLYAIGVLEDGTLTEMNLALEDEEIAFDRCPNAVQETLRNESFAEKIETVGKDIKYGMTIYETVIHHKERSYSLVVAEDGTLVEKVLVIDDEEIEITKCPAAVQASLHEHAMGGRISEVTRSTGIGRPTYEAEVEWKGKVYLIEVGETGFLLSKSLEAGAN